MNKQFVKDALVWGFALWLVGYILGFILFPIVPPTALGWVIMPIGVIMTVWVLSNKVKGLTLQYYLAIAIVWTLIAVVCDYLFLVQVLKPADGYYKLDVYIYYFLTFALPFLFGVRTALSKTRV